MEPDDSEIAALLRVVVQSAVADAFALTEYARQRAWDEMSWDRHDVRLQLQELVVGDFHRVERSRGHPNERIWVFTPEVEDWTLWIRIVQRAGIIIVSFHPG